MSWYDKSKLVGRFRKLNDSEKLRIYEFRDNPTPAEAVVWEMVRNKQLNGYKFRRQHKIGQFIVDFYCHKAGLVIEVDGDVHAKREIEDNVRTDWLNTIGLKVLRFTNDEVLNERQVVKDKILATLTTGR